MEELLVRGAARECLVDGQASWELPARLHKLQRRHNPELGIYIQSQCGDSLSYSQGAYILSTVRPVDQVWDYRGGLEVLVVPEGHRQYVGGHRGARVPPEIGHHRSQCQLLQVVTTSLPPCF